jgi:hypothetical protein
MVCCDKQSTHLGKGHLMTFFVRGGELLLLQLAGKET